MVLLFILVIIYQLIYIWLKKRVVAALVTTIVLVLLFLFVVYFGVFKIDNVLPDFFIMDDPIGCTDFRITSENLKIYFTNNFGKEINTTNFELRTCTKIDECIAFSEGNLSWEEGEHKIVEMNVSHCNLEIDRDFKGYLHTKSNSGEIYGYFETTVEP